MPAKVLLFLRATGLAKGIQTAASTRNKEGQSVTGIRKLCTDASARRRRRCLYRFRDIFIPTGYIG